MGNRECERLGPEERDGKEKKERRGLRQRSGFYTRFSLGRRRATLPRIKRHRLIDTRGAEKRMLFSNCIYHLAYNYILYSFRSPSRPLPLSLSYVDFLLLDSIFKLQFKLNNRIHKYLTSYRDLNPNHITLVI